MRVIGVAWVFLGLAVAGACSGTTSGTSDTRWADACKSDGDCKPGFTCADSGVCERDDSPAGSLDGGGGEGGSGGGTSGSGTGGRGSAGAPPRGGGPAGSGTGSGARPSATEFADVHVPQDFTDPVSLPPPDTRFSGNLDELLGVWIEKSFSGGPCTPSAPASQIQDTVCTRLELRKDANGTYSGTVSRRESTLNGGVRVKGPIAPASDFESGYPTEYGPREYGFFREFTAGIDYRVFDGVYRDGVLSFWLSPLDVWQEWCAAQTPHPWDIDGRKEYRCVPQAADESNTDLGKLALCTSVDDLARCKETGSGMDAPCACLDDDGHFDSTMPLCSLAYCECSRTNCVAFTRNSSVTGHFVLEGGELRGDLTVITPGAIPMTLIKASP